jgi:hypothetical protein
MEITLYVCTILHVILLCYCRFCIFTLEDFEVVFDRPQIRFAEELGVGNCDSSQTGVNQSDDVHRQVGSLGISKC